MIPFFVKNECISKFTRLIPKKKFYKFTLSLILYSSYNSTTTKKKQCQSLEEVQIPLYS